MKIRSDVPEPLRQKCLGEDSFAAVDSAMSPASVSAAFNRNTAVSPVLLCFFGRRARTVPVRYELKSYVLLDALQA
jgi:hypothetical protein